MPRSPVPSNTIEPGSGTAERLALAVVWYRDVSPTAMKICVRLRIENGTAPVTETAAGLLLHESTPALKPGVQLARALGWTPAGRFGGAVAVKTELVDEYHAWYVTRPREGELPKLVWSVLMVTSKVYDEPVGCA